MTQNWNCTTLEEAADATATPAETRQQLRIRFDEIRRAFEAHLTSEAVSSWDQVCGPAFQRSVTAELVVAARLRIEADRLLEQLAAARAGESEQD